MTPREGLFLLKKKRDDSFELKIASGNCIFIVKSTKSLLLLLHTLGALGRKDSLL